MRFLFACMLLLGGLESGWGYGTENPLQGNVFDANAVSVAEQNGYLNIHSTAMPNHATGQFPNRNNPNTIAPQNISVRIPLNPQWSGRIIDVRTPGIARNGILFEPGTAECFGQSRGRPANFNSVSRQRGRERIPPGGAPQACDWREEAIVNGHPRLGLDSNNAHVQPTGMYHYHGISSGLISMLNADKNGLIHVGYAADGYLMVVDPQGRYRSSWQLKSGERPSGPGGRYDGSYTADFTFVSKAGELDECNGMRVENHYVYVLTTTFPFVPRCLKGIPDPSFQRLRPMPG